MTGEDKLPVLALLRPDPRSPLDAPASLAAHAPGPSGTGADPARGPAATSEDRADPEALARAREALKGAETSAAARARPEQAASAPRQDTDDEEGFSDASQPRRQPRPARHGAAPAAAPRRAPDPKTASRKARPGGSGQTACARRILSLQLPRFAIERRLRTMARDEAGAEAPPLVLAVEGRHGPVVHATSRGAEALGVRIGARLVDARALAPELVVDYADPAGDAAALSRLMLWVRRWCPWTAIDGSGAAALLLDTTGSDHLHGGEEALLREIEDRLAGLGLSSRLALAPTPGAAWALARHTGPRTRCLPDGLAQALAPLPVEALRLGEGTVLTLQRLGLSTIGALAAVPRLSLARRFGRTALEDNPLLRLDQAMGTLAEPLSSPEEPPRFAAQARLAEPVLDPVPHLPSLAQDLCADLAAEGFGARRLRLTLYRTDGLVTRAEAATARPSREAGHLLRLFDERLERLDPGYGFDLIALEAIVAEALGARQHALGGGREEAADLARLIDRLSARFGAPALTRPALIESHLPERQSRWIPALAGTPGAFPAALILRPLRLFDPPEEVRVLYAVPEGPPAQFSWRRQTWRIARFAGPERIAPEWWTDRPGTRLRDYYRIEEQTGRRFWLYREGLLGDGRGEGPRWFLHGAFA